MIRKRIARLTRLFYTASQRPTLSKAGYLSYRCNICDHACETRVADLGREIPSCGNCGSTVRMRSIIQILSVELFGKSLALSEFPVRSELRGLGLSDWSLYAEPLARKLNYTNTYFHREPRLDIAAEPDPKIIGTLDFLIASDVFEHVAPPVSRAFENCYRLLKPTGVLVFTVPYVTVGATREHFPDLYQYHLTKLGDSFVMENITRDGVKQAFHDLLFHGGAGETLEMRLFSESSLIEEFERAGFTQIKICKQPDFEHGVYWNRDWSGGSFPMSVRK